MSKTKSIITHKLNINGSFVDACGIPTTQEENAGGIISKFKIFSSMKYKDDGNKVYIQIGTAIQQTGDTWNIHIYEFSLYGLTKPVIRLEVLQPKNTFEIEYNDDSE